MQIVPSGDLGKKWSVNLFPVPDHEHLKISRFSPERSNLQLDWFFPGEVESNILWYIFVTDKDSAQILYIRIKSLNLVLCITQPFVNYLKSRTVYYRPMIPMFIIHADCTVSYSSFSFILCKNGHQSCHTINWFVPFLFFFPQLVNNLPHLTTTGLVLLML